MAQMTILIIKNSNTNSFEATLGTTEMNSFEKSKFSEHSNDQKSKLKSEANGGHSNPTHSASLHFDSLDETSQKYGTGNSDPKKTSKSNENHHKSGFKKVSPDVRWNHVANGTNDSKWLAGEKLEKSQSDLSSSKWLSINDNNFKSDYNHRSHAQILNSSESDIFPSRSGISSNPNEHSTSRPQPLFKSSSSSQLPSIRGNYLHANKPWKYGGSSSTARPISVASIQQTYAPHSIYLQNHASYGKNFCSCNEINNKKTNRTESFLSLAEVTETPEGLSWRRLHMSRAKLKATATTSELLSGFAMVAMVELQINKPTAVPEWLFVLFAVCTTILVSVHIFALMISTYLLPNIDAVSKLHVSSLVTESPHDRMKSFIELAWAFSTILGLFLFLVEIAILCWVKFWDYSFTAAMSATMIILPVLVLFVAFAMHFYHSLVVIKCKTSISNMQELENMKRQLDNVSPA